MKICEADSIKGGACAQTVAWYVSLQTGLGPIVGKFLCTQHLKEYRPLDMIVGEVLPARKVPGRTAL